MTVAQHKHIAARDVDALVRAQCKEVHGVTSGSSGKSSSSGGKGLITTMLDVAAHLGR